MNPSNLVKKIGAYNYLKDDLLGEGSTGRVYLGLHQQSEKKVAIKVIDMTQIDNEVTKYLLECEKEALLNINNGNVLKGLDVYEQQKQCFIITQYCSGGSLKEYIKKNKCLRELESMEIFRKLLIGYKAIKDHHFIHRDLKASNVMMEGKEPVIIDFGYCEKTFGSKPKVFYNVGSPSYMSPEAYYKTIYSEKSDIWALGIILYEMLTGFTIDRGQPINRYFTELIKNGYRLPTVSEECKKIVDFALKINPQERARTTDLINLVDKYFQKNNQKASSFSTADGNKTSNTASQKSEKIIPEKRKIMETLHAKSNRISTPVQSQNFHTQKANDRPQIAQSMNHQPHPIYQYQEVQRAHQFKGFPDPLMKKDPSSSEFFPKPTNTPNNANMERNKFLTHSWVPEPSTKKQEFSQKSYDFLKSTKMTESLIVGEPVIQMNPEFEKKKMVQSMHQNARIQNELHYAKANSLNPSFHPHYTVVEKGMVRNPSNYQGNHAPNVHYDFMVNARNAFMKKTNPPVQEVQKKKNFVHMIPQQISPQNVFFNRKK